MIENKRLVPDRADIDHVDNNRLNDSVENLKPRDARCNRREGFEIQMEKNLQSWNALLDFIQFMGYPPPDGHPLWS